MCSIKYSLPNMPDKQPTLLRCGPQNKTKCRSQSYHVLPNFQPEISCLQIGFQSKLLITREIGNIEMVRGQTIHRGEQLPCHRYRLTLKVQTCFSFTCLSHRQLTREVVELCITEQILLHIWDLPNICVGAHSLPNMGVIIRVVLLSTF